MQKIVWLIIGLVIGAAGACAYHIYIREPQLVAQATQTTKEAAEQDALNGQMVISGSLVAIDGAEITVLVAHDVGEPSLATVTTDAATMVYQQENDETATKEKSSLSALPVDSFITITLDTAKTNGNTLYAKEITQI